MVLLWLDDIRDPNSKEVNWLQYAPFKVSDTDLVDWVKNYYGFIGYIQFNGLPDGICFDHDLGKEVEITAIKRGMKKSEARKLKDKEKTGYDCAKWLVDYCLEKDLDIPPYGLQTSNPVGRENISSLLDNYHEHYINTH